MFDRRYPNLIRVSECRHKAVRDLCAAVAGRCTGVKVCLRRSFSNESMWLHVYPQSPGFGYPLPESLASVVRPDGSVRPGLDRTIDDLTRIVKLCQRPAEMQDREMAAAEKSRKHDEDEAFGRMQADRRRDLEKAVDFHHQREGMHSKYARTVTVDGLKKPKKAKGVAA